jgi:thymidylate synthase ThyX
MTEDRPIVIIKNAGSDSEEQRPMSDEEYEDYLARAEQFNAMIEEQAQKAIQKQELLDRLGITEEEARIILS